MENEKYFPLCQAQGQTPVLEVLALGKYRTCEIQSPKEKNKYFLLFITITKKTQAQ